MDNTEYAKIISKNLKRIMIDCDKTQADLSRDLNIPKTTLSGWMNGTRCPKMKSIDMLCNYFRVTRAELTEEHAGYYIDREARDLAEFLHKSPEYRVLFDASRKVKPEDIAFVKQMIDRMANND